MEKTAAARDNGSCGPWCLVYFDGTIQNWEWIIIIAVFKSLPKELSLIFCEYAFVAFNPIRKQASKPYFKMGKLLGRKVAVSIGVIQVIKKDSANVLRLLNDCWSKVLVTLDNKKVIRFLEQGQSSSLVR